MMMLDAGRSVQAAVGDRARVRMAASGPITLAVKLVGMEGLVLSLCMGDGKAVRLLDFATDITEAWCTCVREQGLEIVIFDSMAAPPMFSPGLFEDVVFPRLQRLFQGLEESGQAERELIIGGDTTPMAHLLPATGANVLLCDYAADAASFKTALGDDTHLKVRRNVNPAALLKEDLSQPVEAFLSDLSEISHPIAGTGILPYDFPSDRLLAFRALVERSLRVPRAVQVNL